MQNEKKYLIATGLALVVGILTYAPKQDDLNPTTTIEHLIPSYEEPVPTYTPTPAIKSAKGLTKYNAEKILHK